jgi:hypothetical protein
MRFLCAPRRDAIVIAHMCVLLCTTTTISFGTNESDRVFNRRELETFLKVWEYRDPSKIKAVLERIDAALPGRTAGGYKYTKHEADLVFGVIGIHQANTHETGAADALGAVGNATTEEQPPLAVKPPEDRFTHRFLIRQSINDVVAGENPAVQDPSDGTVNDISGASFSYVHDAKARTDTWSAQGAVMYPVIWNLPLVYGRPAQFGLVPSISLNRSSPDTATNPDSLIFRQGFYADWLLPSKAKFERDAFRGKINVYAGGTWGTDTQFRLSLPGGDFNIEPQFLFPHKFAIGYLEPFNPNKTFTTLDEVQKYPSYQIRVWLHGEGGIFDRSGLNNLPQDDYFFRLGPAVQLKLVFPNFLNGLTLKGEYHFLPSLNGSHGRDNYLTTSAELAIWKDPDLNRQVSVKLAYQNGGLDYTKQEVNNLTLGLGISF